LGRPKSRSVEAGQASTSTRLAERSRRYWNGRMAVPLSRRSGPSTSRMPKKV
jgi:hypothetical protein